MVVCDGLCDREDGKLYSCQFTFLRVYHLGLHPYIIMLAVTDFTTGKHYYMQKVTLSKKGICIDDTYVQFSNIGKITKGNGSIHISGRHPSFGMELELEFGKGPVWHCDNGVLRMGKEGKKETTLYYSYPNMPVHGTLRIEGTTIRVAGKAWFDKQGGPYHLLRRETHWEWFSLRFFDDEEMMLFSFPQSGYQDGTYIRQDGSVQRLQAYTVTPLAFIMASGCRFSSGWDIGVPGLKEERYRVTPLMEGQMNLGYFETLCGIYNGENRQVGMCFAELLPGVYNERYAIELFKRVD